MQERAIWTHFWLIFEALFCLKYLLWSESQPGVFVQVNLKIPHPSCGKGHAGHGGHHIHMALRNLNPKPQMKGESRSKTNIVVMLTLTPLNLFKNVK